MSEDRMSVGDTHDQDAVLPEIRRRGYVLQPFGQALLTSDVRERLRGRKTALMRWLPDQVAMKADDKSWMRSIDSKTNMRYNSSTPYHAIELRSILGITITRIPSVYICSELKAFPAAYLYAILRASSEPLMLQLREKIWPCCDSCIDIVRDAENELQAADNLPEYCPNHSGGGSGTPFIRVLRSWCFPLDQYFPPISNGDPVRLRDTIPAVADELERRRNQNGTR